MSKIVFLRGIPGSGKSTYARDLVTREGYTRVNLDAIRAMLGLEYSPEAEKMAKQVHDSVVLRAMKAGHDVVIDNTHINDATPKSVITMLWENGLDVEYDLVDIQESLEECVRRNQERARRPSKNDSAEVPYEVITRMHSQLEGRRKAGNLWTIEGITSKLPKIEKYVPNYRLPVAVVIDIDGTLAEHHRSPYDYDQLATDGIYDDVSFVIDAIAASGQREMIILCSGRPDDYREATEGWLDEASIPYDHLFMRASGDDRRDSVIKLEIFNREIRDKYNVLFCIDDRDRVVSLYRALGLRCWQVAEGAF